MSNIHSPSISPGEAVVAVGSVVEFVVDHSAHCQRTCITTQERHFAPIQDPHGPLHIVQGSLQVGGLLGHPVELQVQQGNTCCGQSAHTAHLFRVNVTLYITVTVWFTLATDLSTQCTLRSHGGQRS